FGHVYGASFETGQALVMHNYTKAVGFTGSFTGGRQLFDWANARKEPIPVFAEMSSVNPVFLLPGKIAADAENVALKYAASITTDAGQFCTNPGLLVGVESEGLCRFEATLAEAVAAVRPSAMLHEGIY